MTESLPIVEQFHSLQGEGAHSGRSAYFIRLASCKVGCSWCDTKESWSADPYPLKSLTSLAKTVVKAQLNGAGFVVLTGGEPLHHNLNPLCESIRKETEEVVGKSIAIHLETSGVDPISGNPDWITLSPKRHAQPLEELIKICQEMKVIIHEKSDLVFAEQMAEKILSKYNNKTLLYLQPGWNNKKGQELAYEYVKSNSHWRLSMQTHKWLGVL